MKCVRTLSWDLAADRFGIDVPITEDEHLEMLSFYQAEMSFAHASSDLYKNFPFWVEIPEEIRVRVTEKYPLLGSDGSLVFGYKPQERVLEAIMLRSTRRELIPQD